VTKITKWETIEG
jgi:hypothetical protein